MKKKSIYILFTILIFTLSILHVDAFECIYGTGSGDDWSAIVSFRYNSYNDVDMNVYDSSEFTLHGGELALSKGNSSDCNGCNYMDENNIFNHYYMYIYMYANEYDYNTYLKLKEDYCKEKGYSGDECKDYDYMVCPKFIQYSYKKTWTSTEWDSVTGNHYIFYTDSLTEKDLPNSFWDYGVVTDKGYTVLSLKEYKDEEIPSDLRTDGNCSTYNAFYNAMKSAADSKGTCDGNITFQKYYNEILQLCENYRASSDYAGNYSSTDQKISGCMTACSHIRDDVVEICGYDVDSPNQDGSCYSLGTGVLGWIMKILNMIRYIVPVILIILGIMDFIKAIATDDDGEIKKAGSRFVKRLIAASLIFVVPLILKFVLGMFNLPGLDSSNPFCL